MAVALLIAVFYEIYICICTYINVYTYIYISVCLATPPSPSTPPSFEHRLDPDRETEAEADRLRSPVAVEMRAAMRPRSQQTSNLVNCCGLFISIVSWVMH